MKSAIIVVFCVALVLSVALLLMRPTVTVENTQKGIVLHLETLGEYPSTIREIAVLNASTGQAVLDLVSQEGTPQLYKISLIRGINFVRSIDPEHGTYRVVAPKNGESFALQPGVTYKIVVHKSRWLVRTVSFKLS